MSKLAVWSTVILLAGVGPVWSQSPSFDVFSRPVSEAEIAGGAPAGTVFDLFADTEQDLLLIGMNEIAPSLFQHPLGSDTGAPMPDFVSSFPALGADSWFATPGSTAVVGDGFSMTAGGDTAWFDTENLGGLSDYHFGRLTIPSNSSANFQGNFHLRGENGPKVHPFQFAVDSSGGFNWSTLDPIIPPVNRLPENPTTLPPSLPPTLPPELHPPTLPPPTGDPVLSSIFNTTSRRVSSEEMAAGVPGGTVLDVSVSTASDILLVALKDISLPIYNHALGSDTGPVSSDPVLTSLLDPALSADSWMTTPGSTAIAGDGFDFLEGLDTAWFDASNDGPQTDFQIARFTIPDGSEGVLSGHLARKSEGRFIQQSFELSATADGAWEMSVADAFRNGYESSEPAPSNDPDFLGPVNEDPVAEDPVFEEPVVEVSVVEDPVVEVPVAEESIVRDPALDESVVSEPVGEEPVLIELNEIYTRETIDLSLPFRYRALTWEVVSFDGVLQLASEGSSLTHYELSSVAVADFVTFGDESIAQGSSVRRLLDASATKLALESMILSQAIADGSATGNPLPEPGTCLMALLGLLGSTMLRYRDKRAVSHLPAKP